MRLISEFTQDKPFRPYQITLHVETKDDQDFLRYFFECGQRSTTTPAHSKLYEELLDQLEP